MHRTPSSFHPFVAHGHTLVSCESACMSHRKVCDLQPHTCLLACCIVLQCVLTHMVGSPEVLTRCQKLGCCDVALHAKVHVLPEDK